MGRVLRQRNGTVSSTDGSDSSQASVVNKPKRSRTILTDNSRNIRVRNKIQKENCTDSASSENEEIRNRVKTKGLKDTSNDKGGTNCTSSIDGRHVDSIIIGTNKNEAERSVLLDKTNSILKNKMNNSESKTKHKVHFSATNRTRKITQRRISDFFHVGEFYTPHDGQKSPRSCQREHKKQILECICHPNTENNEELCGSNCKRVKKLNETNHIPVYNLPAINGNNSFRLTPPQVKDKNTLYEFEVDENEPVVNVKKRRHLKTNKRRKRLCRIDDNLKSSEIIQVPQRTMALRNDGNSNNGRIDYNEHNNSNVLDTTDVYDPLSSNLNKNRLHIKSSTAGKTNYNRLNQIGNKENIPKPIDCLNSVGISTQVNAKRIVGNLSNDQQNVNKPATYCQNSETPSVSYSNNDRSKVPVDIIKDISFCKTGTNTSNNTLLSSSSSNVEQNHADVANASQPLHDDSANMSVSNSPLPEYSRIDEGILGGPCYTSSLINCSDAEYNNNFVRGITASTPFRTIIQKTPARVNINNNHTQVRLSGGEISNSFTRKLVNQSDDSNEDENFFGFKESEIHDESYRHALTNSHKSVVEEPDNNEPVQKITVNEVIKLLKQEIGNKSKRHKPTNKVTFLKMFDANKDSNSSGSSGEDTSDTSGSMLSPDQPTIKGYITKNSSAKSDDIQKVEPSPNKSFTKPPRRSYTCPIPRRTKRLDYKDNEVSDDEVEEEKVPKKPIHKKTKISKKEEKEMEKLAAMMNSQFQQVDNFSLVVE